MGLLIRDVPWDFYAMARDSRGSIQMPGRLPQRGGGLKLQTPSWNQIAFHLATPCSEPGCSAAKLCPTLQPHGLWPARFPCPQDSPNKNTGVGCLKILQGIFLTQDSNPCPLYLLHWQWAVSTKVKSLPRSNLRVLPGLWRTNNAIHIRIIYMLCIYGQLQGILVAQLNRKADEQPLSNSSHLPWLHRHDSWKDLFCHRKHIFRRILRWYAAAAAKLLQSCPTPCDPIDRSPPGSPVPGILQARTLEWAAISFSNAWKWKVKVKSLNRVRLLATPCSLPSSSFHGSFQARVLE